MSRKSEYALELKQEDILKSYKAGNFTRFKPAMKNRGVRPFRKFQAMAAKKLYGKTLEEINELPLEEKRQYYIGDIFVHQDDLNLLEKYEEAWLVRHEGLGIYSEQRRSVALGLHFLNESPNGSLSPGIERGHIYLRRPRGE